MAMISSARQTNLAKVFPAPFGERNSVPQTDAEKSLYDFLDMGVQMQRKMKMTRVNGYCSTNDFLIQHGAFYPWAPLPGSIEKGLPNACYYNAALLAATDSDLFYVEGIASSVIPLPHAWCVDREGRVVDPTWVEEGPVPRKRAYLGIPVDMQWYHRNTSPDNASVIDNWQKKWPLLWAKPGVYLPKDRKATSGLSEHISRI